MISRVDKIVIPDKLWMAINTDDFKVASTKIMIMIITLPTTVHNTKIVVMTRLNNLKVSLKDVLLEHRSVLLSFDIPKILDMSLPSCAAVWFIAVTNLLKFLETAAWSKVEAGSAWPRVWYWFWKRMSECAIVVYRNMNDLSVISLREQVRLAWCYGTLRHFQQYFSNIVSEWVSVNTNSTMF